MPSVNEHIQDELTTRDLYLERHKRYLLTRVIALLARLEEAVLAKIVKLSPVDVQPRYRDARLARLLAEVQSQTDDYAKALQGEVIPGLGTLAQDEATFGVKLFRGAIPVQVDVAAPSAANVRAAVMSRPFQGRILKEWVEDQGPATRMRLRNVIRQGVADGSTIDDMVRSIRGTAASNYTDGVMETTRRSAQAMVRTAVNHTVSFARESTYEANQDLIKGVRWVSTLDSRTSEVCMARDGKVWPVNKGPRPPAHPNCRSSTVPIVKSWKELGIDLADAPEGTRASMDGQVAESQTYQTWLGKKPAAFQDEVLGPTKGALFRRGGLTLDKFVDNSGHAYTLDELRKRQPGAFEAAGLG